MGVLADKRILVVGASSGIGRAVGAAATVAGARVAFAARRADRVKEAAAEAGNGAIGVACDVTEEHSCAALVDEVTSTFGGLDALVYAAGISPLTRLSEADGDAWERVLRTNLVGPGLVCAAALPHLKSSGGRAVFLSSSSVGRPYPGLSMYAASKAALEEQIRGWRAENPDLCFSCVVVGPTLGTEFADAWDPQLMGEILQFWHDHGYDAGTAAVMSLRQMTSVVIDVLASSACLWHVWAQADPNQLESQVPPT
jgi:NAD(P)-dependent dehydrogenase (short-subunit alcohol dehydrogenase family)